MAIADMSDRSRSGRKVRATYIYDFDVCTCLFLPKPVPKCQRREEKRRSSAISAVETPAATFSGSRLTNIDLGHTTNLLLGASDFSSSFKKINSFSDMVCKPAKRTASWRALLLEEPVLFGVEDECFFSGDFFDEHTIKI